MPVWLFCYGWDPYPPYIATLSMSYRIVFLGECIFYFSYPLIFLFLFIILQFLFLHSRNSSINHHHYCFNIFFVSFTHYLSNIYECVRKESLILRVCKDTLSEKQESTLETSTLAQRVTLEDSTVVFVIWVGILFKYYSQQCLFFIFYFYFLFLFFIFIFYIYIYI